MGAKDYDWFKLSREMVSLIRSEKLTMSEMNLFLHIVEGVYNEKSICYTTQGMIVEKTGKTKQAVSKTLMKLIGMNIIGKVKSGYMVNPTTVYAGGKDSRVDAIKLYVSLFKTTIFTDRKKNKDE